MGSFEFDPVEFAFSFGWALMTLGALATVVEISIGGPTFGPSVLGFSGGALTLVVMSVRRGREVSST